MNEFDELFNEKKKEEEQPTIIFPSDNQIDPNEEILKLDRLQRHNGVLILIYIGMSILFSVFSLFYVQMTYGDTTVILDNINLVADPTITVTDSTDSTQPWEISISAQVQNENSIDIPIIYMEIIFYSDNGEEFSYTIQEKDIVAGQIVLLEDTVLSTFDPVSYDVNLGFDFSGLFYTLVGLLPIAFSAILFLIIDRESFAYDTKRFKKDFWNHVGTIVFGFVMVWVALLLSQMILTLLGVEGTSENEMTIQNMFTANPLNLIMLFLLLCVATPITEEVVFRKVIYNFVEKRSNYIVAIIATGAIFGLMHVINYGDFIQSIPYILMGLVFGFIYFYSKKNILVTIGVHFINNFITFMIYVLMVYGFNIY